MTGVSAFARLCEWRQFVASNSDGVPVNPRTGTYFAKGSDWLRDPAHWVTHAEAARVPGCRPAFVLTDADPFWCLDIDDCLQVDGQWSPLAIELCQLFAGCAIEVSKSGRGLHIWGAGAVPPHKCVNTQLGIELYHTAKAMTLGHPGATGDCGHNATAELRQLVDRYFPVESAPAAEPGWPSIRDDAELIAKAKAHRSAGAMFGANASFSDLWAGDPAVLARFYPPQKDGQIYNGSSADLALALHLAFWTGKDGPRIERLMRESGLIREKWERADYLTRTIASACAKVVAPPPPPAPKSDSTGEEALSVGSQYLGAHGQQQHFRGCVYVASLDRVFTPNGQLLKSSQFNAMFGGYVFQIDDSGKKTTRKAFEALTESQVVRFPKAHAAAFQPLRPPGATFNAQGLTYVNTYIPAAVECEPGDVAPFLTHVRKLLPNPNDSAILLAYLAACVQHVGVKFQWCPLIQGVEGNGKTLFTRVLVAALGERHAFLPRADMIDEKFNTWLFSALFVGVEDIYVAESRTHLWEYLKPVITGERQSRRGMQQEWEMGDVCANFVLNSNHLNAVRKTKNDRRLSVFYTAQQTASDLARDGLDSAYFTRLYRWLKEGGYAKVTHWLRTYEIPDELNPATLCQRAPTTTSTLEAIEGSRGSVEQEIQEAIAEGRPGFAGGWVSSVALDKLLTDMRAQRAIPPNQRRALMQDLGFDWHPALQDGRAPSAIAIDGHKKPRLYIREGHIRSQITLPAAAVAAYETAQRGLTDDTEKHKTKAG